VPGTGWLLEAYRDLSSCRPADGPIPWTAVTLYADKTGLEPDVGELLWSVVRRMDHAERKWMMDNSAGSGEGTMGGA
jgi:hypothetical protein